MSMLRRLSLLVLGLSFLMTGYALAQSKPRDPLVEMTLVSEYSAVKPGQTIWVALHQDIYPGWHTYWTNAGDAGAPPEVAWDLPEGYEAGPIQFPPPERVPYMSLMNFGYSDEVILPIRLTVPESAEIGSSIFLNGHASWLVCEDLCIPEDGPISLLLKIGSENVKSRVWGDLVREAVQSLPGPSPWEVTYEIADDAFHILLKAPDLVEAFQSRTIQEASFFPRQQGLIENAAEQNFDVTNDGLRLSLPRPTGFGELDLPEVSGVFVFNQDLADGTQVTAFEFVGQEADVAPSGGLNASSVSLPVALLFAFLGGLILNVMPCVFPVLFLKAFSVMKKAGKERKAIRIEGLTYTAGVVSSFVFLGALLFALRAGGEAIGWGFQLQTPGIVGALVLLLFLVGLSLSGVFSLGGVLMGAGSDLADQDSTLGSFFTGVLATVVATPCTAPFMGAAMGFALTQPAFVSILVFVFLGLGMALPFLLFSFFPGLAGLLPKPGAWMERAKQILALPMYGAALWLLWVFSLQVSTLVFGGLVLLLVLVGGAFWFFGKTRMEEGKKKDYGTRGAVAAIAILVIFLIQIDRIGNETSLPQEPGISNGMAYEVFSDARVAELVAEGKPVFVNFTAAWCISCLANEKVVFRSDDVREKFAETGITYLKADWTNRDAVIANVLAKFGRAGVPLYLYYAPGSSEPEILPQLLTPGIVLEAIE